MRSPKKNLWESIGGSMTDACGIHKESIGKPLIILREYLRNPKSSHRASIGKPLEIIREYIRTPK